MGSVPLVTCFADSRNLATCLFFGCLAILIYKGIVDFEVRLLSWMPENRSRNKFGRKTRDGRINSVWIFTHLTAKSYYSLADHYIRQYITVEWGPVATRGGIGGVRVWKHCWKQHQPPISGALRDFFHIHLTFSRTFRRNSSTGFSFLNGKRECGCEQRISVLISVLSQYVFFLLNMWMNFIEIIPSKLIRIL